MPVPVSRVPKSWELTNLVYSAAVRNPNKVHVDDNNGLPYWLGNFLSPRAIALGSFTVFVGLTLISASSCDEVGYKFPFLCPLRGNVDVPNKFRRAALKIIHKHIVRNAAVAYVRQNSTPLQTSASPLPLRLRIA